MTARVTAIDDACGVMIADARRLPFPASTVDVVVTSPPYWKKRDYGFDGQIGQERTPEMYVEAISDCLSEWARVLRSTGSVFLNVGDTYHQKSLAGIPGMIEQAARRRGWLVRNRIVWAKEGGMPDPATNRLASRHEYVIHLTRSDDYFYDLFGYAEGGPNPGDVWRFEPERNMGKHLAPFPSELVRRCLALACPERVCVTCGEPRCRVVGRTRHLDPTRPQAKRAMDLAAALSDEHIAAIQATGISDAGKALSFQTGTGRNSERVQRLAAEAKAVLGGYFREFTFARKETIGWTSCSCGNGFAPGVVLDPFLGTGTTRRVTEEMGRLFVGGDLDLRHLADTDEAVA